MELCLGTVQFGMDYGIRGQKQPHLSDALGMLDYAINNEIKTIDTANAYGEAEDIVGAYFAKNKSVRTDIQLISKFRPNLLDDVPLEQYYSVMKKNLSESLRRLHTDYLDGYLLHSARYVFHDAILDTLIRLRKEGYVRAVGVSVYEVEEAQRGIQYGNLDFLQLPYSALDQRMLHGDIFPLALSHHIPLHTRSAFIQGLILMKEHEVPSFLERSKPLLRQIDLLCREYGITRIQLAFGFVKQQRAISRLVFGVDNLEQLKEDIVAFSQDLPSGVIQELEQKFSDIDADIVMPSLWKK